MFTNGIEIEAIIEAFSHRIGWKQPTDSRYAIVDADNQESYTGRYFNDGSFHPLVTIKNIRETIEDASINDVAFNEHLLQIQKSATVQCLSKVFNNPELIDNTTLFERYGNNDAEIVNSGKFVGIRFRVAAGHSLKINTISCLFSKAEPINLLLYHERKRLPIATIPITTGENEVINITPDIKHLNNSDQLSGCFFLGYYQDRITGNAIDESGIKSKTKVVGFDSFEARAFEQDSDMNFDRKGFSYSNKTYGLNLEISTFSDYTDRVIRNAFLFDNAIGLQLAHDVAKAIMYSTRSNKDQRILNTDLDKMGLQYELDGKVPISDVPKSSGLQDKINAELKIVRESFFPLPKAQSVSLC